MSLATDILVRTGNEDDKNKKMCEQSGAKYHKIK